LGLLAIQSGDQGRFLAPYLQARQLLNKAISECPPNVSIPAAYNARGLAYVSLILRYSDYQLLFEESNIRDLVSKELGETQPLSILTLARRADADFERAIATNTSTFSRARYLNNRVDLRMQLLAAIHLDGRQFQPVNEAEASVVHDNLDPPPTPAPRDWNPLNLAAILDTLDAQLTEASTLSAQPEIFFTRAQLYSIAGELNDKYALGRRWADNSGTRRHALRDLETATQLGLSPRLIDQQRAAEFRLGWLWKGSEIRILLERLQGRQG
jgi:hypothetical protein